jgi:hypothetical protein
MDSQPDQAVRLTDHASRMLNQLVITESAIQSQLRSDFYQAIGELAGIEELESLLNGDAPLSDDWLPWLHVYYHLLAAQAEADTAWLNGATLQTMELGSTEFPMTVD